MKHIRIYKTGLWKKGMVLSLLFTGILAFSACTLSTDIPSPNDEPEQPVIPEEEAYLSFTAELQTKTKGYINKEDKGTLDEYCVNNVRMVLYEATGSDPKVVRYFDFKIKTDQSGSGTWIDYSSDTKDLAPTSTQTGECFTTYARKVPAMNYQMLVIANINSSLRTITEEGKALSLLQTAVAIETDTKTSDIGGLATNKNFLMLNEGALVPVSTTNLRSSVREAHNSPVAVTIGRIVSKVSLTLSDGVTQIPVDKVGAAVDQLTWELDITNRHTYWIKKGNPTGVRWYGEDPNYSNISDLDVYRRRAHFYYHSAYSTAPTTLRNVLGGVEYCLENTMDYNEQSKDNVITSILIRCRYKPINIKNLGDGFYVYKSNTYSIDEMRQFAEEVEKLPASMLSGLYKEISDNKKNNVSFLTGKPVYINTNEECMASKSWGNIVYYYQGVNYYTIKILHNGNSDTEPVSVGKYGVLRNTSYRVNLLSIDGPGSEALPRETYVRSTADETTVRPEQYGNIKAHIEVEM